MKNLNFPNGWFNLTTFRRANGISQGCQKNLIHRLCQNGSVEPRTALKGNRLVKLYRQIRRRDNAREVTYSPTLLNDLFEQMGLNEQPILTNETQPVN
jgi:hypothetical protein